MASATSVDPAAHARRLTGRTDILAVTDDGAPTGQRTIALWEPGFLPDTQGEHDAPVRRAANSEAADIMGHIIATGARTLTFVRSRRGAEMVAINAAEKLARGTRRRTAGSWSGDWTTASYWAWLRRMHWSSALTSAVLMLW